MPVMKLSDLLGVKPSDNPRYVDERGYLTREFTARSLPPGGCAAILSPDGNYCCELCRASWLPAPSILPPCYSEIIT